MKKVFISLSVLLVFALHAAMATPSVHQPAKMSERTHLFDESYMFDDPGFGRSSGTY